MEPLRTLSKRSFAGSDRLADAGALTLLAAVVVVFFWPVISAQAWIPQGGGDLVSFIFPMYRFIADSLRAGQIPLWNPFLYAGAPLISDNQSGAFYPFNLILFFLRPEFSYGAIEGLVIWHFFFAGAAMYVCLRWYRPSGGFSRPAALVGSLCFMLSGAFITHIGHLNYISVAAWLPLSFLGLHRAMTALGSGKRLAWAAGSGAALGVGTLAGHGQATFLAATFLGTYALYRAVSERDKWALPLLGVAAIVALLVAAISLFPAIGAFQHTLRAEFDFERAGRFSLPWRGLTGLFAPDFYGRGITNFWGDWERVEFGYAGVIPWFLAASAVIVKPSKRTFFFAMAIGLFLLLALGANSPIYGLIFRNLTFFPFRVPARFVLLVDFSLAILAAKGIDSLASLPLSRKRSRWMMLIPAVAALLFVAAALWQAKDLAAVYPAKQRQMLVSVLVFALFSGGSWLLLISRLRDKLSWRSFGWLAFALLAVDLVGLGRYVEIEWNVPTQGYASESEAVRYLQSDPGIHRIDVATDRWQPSFPQMAGLYAIGGVFNPLQLANYSVYTGSMGSRGSALYNLLGVKYVIGDKLNPPADTNIIVPVFDDDPDVTVYLNTLALPRAMVLYEAVAVPDHDAAFDAIHSPAFDPQRTLIVEGGRPLNETPGESQIRIVRYDPNGATFDVTVDRTAYLLLSDINHPDWRATDNGMETEIVAADYAFRAIWLEAGNHRIVFRYQPAGWQAGLLVTLFTCLLGGVLTIWMWRKSR